jgi:hypothetical protein
MGKSAGQAPPGSSYAEQRPYVVIESLDGLRGPTSGVVSLDRRLHWSGAASFDLEDPRRLARLYETVLREASHTGELAQWLDGSSLVRLWPTLVLPPQVRTLWESRFKQLRRTAA